MATPDERVFCTFQNLYPQLLRMLTPNGVQASDYRLFKGAIFGRDSAYVALDLLPWAPALARQVIMSLACHIGLRTDNQTGEESGRIHHECRTARLGSECVSPEVLATMAKLRQTWGIGTNDELISYSTVDATPLFVILVHRYAAQYGRDIFAARVAHHSGEILDLRTLTRLAVDWIIGRIKRSDLGLIEFLHTNPMANRWEVMRDGHTSYLHTDGRLANYDLPIAALDVQGLTYEALILAGRASVAHRLREQTIASFWMPKQRYFAMALDRDSCGKARQVQTLSSAAAELLATGFFDGHENAVTYIGAITRQLLDEDFLTPVGIRMRAKRYADLVDYWEYQGAHASWYNVTNRFAVGLRHYGLIGIAQFIDGLLLDGIERSGACVEFSYVDTDGVPDYEPLSKNHRGQRIDGTSIPENAQAWTVSAALRALYMEQTTNGSPAQAPASWQQQLTQATLPDAVSYVAKLKTLRPRRFYIDLATGRRLEDAFDDSPKP